MRVIFLFSSSKHTKLLIGKAICQIHLYSKTCVTLFFAKPAASSKRHDELGLAAQLTHITGLSCAPTSQDISRMSAQLIVQRARNHAYVGQAIDIPNWMSQY